MELVDSKKLESVAKFLTGIEVDGNYLCGSFLEYLDGSFNAPKCVDDEALCMEDCPLKSTYAFIRWFKKPYKKLDVECLKKPKKDGSLCYDNRSGGIVYGDDYITALEKYCNDLESVLADTEYDLETEQCENRELTNRLEKIRGALDEHD